MYDCLKLIYAYLNEGDQGCEYYSCLKVVVQVHLHVGFFTIFFIKRAWLKRFYLYLKCCAIKHNFLNKKIITKCLVIEIFAWNFLQLLIQKSFIVITEKYELAFLLILCFHGSKNNKLFKVYVQKPIFFEGINEFNWCFR